MDNPIICESGVYERMMGTLAMEEMKEHNFSMKINGVEVDAFASYEKLAEQFRSILEASTHRPLQSPRLPDELSIQKTKRNHLKFGEVKISQKIKPISRMRFCGR